MPLGLLYHSLDVLCTGAEGINFLKRFGACERAPEERSALHKAASQQGTEAVHFAARSALRPLRCRVYRRRQFRENAGVMVPAAGAMMQ